MSIQLVLVTAPGFEVAQCLAKSAVTSDLAACVSIIPQIISIYKWEGKIHEENEVQMLFKTTTKKLPLLESFITTEHPYACPEFISISAEHVESSYLSWLSNSLTSSQE
jgi:periplasmic divalent cation tolerance protein